MLARHSRRVLPTITRWARMNSDSNNKQPSPVGTGTVGSNEDRTASDNAQRGSQPTLKGSAQSPPLESFTSPLNKTKSSVQPPESPMSEAPIQIGRPELEIKLGDPIQEQILSADLGGVADLSDTRHSGEPSKLPDAAASEPSLPGDAHGSSEAEASNSTSSQSPGSAAAENQYSSAGVSKFHGMFDDMPLSRTQKVHLEELTADCETQEELDRLLASPELQYLLALQELKDLVDTPEPILSSLPLPGKAMYQPLHHTPQWRIPVATITFQGYFPERLMLFTHFAVHAASALGIPTSKVYALPKQRRLWTVPKSPFVHKGSQENFERITHSRGVKAWDADPLTIDMWTSLLSAYAMAGVGMRVVRWSRVKVGGGGTELKKVDQVLDDILKRRGANMRDGNKVRRLGEQIVEKELAVAQQAEREEIINASEA